MVTQLPNRYTALHNLHRTFEGHAAEMERSAAKARCNDDAAADACFQVSAETWRSAARYVRSLIMMED